MRTVAFALIASLSVGIGHAAAEPVLDTDQQAALRCAAAFGIIGNDQKRGDKAARKWPPLAERGPAYLAKVRAELMAKRGLSDADVQKLYKAEIDKLQGEAIAAKDPKALVRTIMVPCVARLNAALPKGTSSK